MLRQSPIDGTINVIYKRKMRIAQYAILDAGGLG